MTLDVLHDSNIKSVKLVNLYTQKQLFNKGHPNINILNSFNNFYEIHLKHNGYYIVTIRKLT